jgi:glutathione S-transferase
MKLYHMPGTCALAAHIVLNELGVPAEFVAVARDTRKTADGEDYYGVNPNGYVPALRLDDGSVLTENAAILPYIGDLKPDSGFMPRPGPARYRAVEWLGYVNSELHANYKPLFMNQDPDGFWMKRLAQRYKRVEDALGKNAFLTGDRPTIADAYLYVVTRWADRVKVDLSPFPNLQSFMKRMGERPAVRKSLGEQGLA